MMNPQGSRIARSPLQTARLGLALALAALLPVSAAIADAEGYYIETVNRSAGVMGEAPSQDLSKTYLAYDKMKVVNEGPDATDMIMDPAAGTITFINHAEKEYLPINVKSVMESMSGPAAEQMRAMMGEMTVKVEATGETKKIGDWNATQYRVTKTGMMAVDQEIWATEDVDLDVARYTDMMSLSGPGGMLANSPAGIAQREEMSKIKGYPILTKTKMEMMGTTMETETEVTVIRQEAIPADIFAIPQGYGERDMSVPMAPPGGAHP
ncbi:MAG: DUF4412 domain-containing protein [Gammaproteobacteria bacterium]|nr:DUF4412 domain-containing protein [Gammaproteobacteria bacterium]